MKDTVHLPSILGLSNISIENAEMNSQGEFIITAKSTRKEIKCKKCGLPASPHGCGRVMKLRHLPIFGHETYIQISLLRGICRNCTDHPTSTESHDWYSSGSAQTKSYEKYILLSLINSTISDVSIKENIKYKSIEGIVDRYIEAKVNWNNIEEIGLLGIDEISLKKGHQDFVTLITSRTDAGIKIINIIKGREKAEIKKFLLSVPLDKRSTIIAVCTDLYDGFVNAAKEAFGTGVPVIVDRYHVSKLYRKCLVSIRKAELKRLRKDLSEEEYHSLKPAISLLRSRKEYNMSEDEKKVLQPLFNHSPKLKQAYDFCIELTAIYNEHQNQEDAASKIDDWVVKVQASTLSCFNSFVKTIKKYRSEICNYFIDRNSSGFVEGFNNKVKVLKRRCYGIFNLKHLFQRIFLDFSGRSFLSNNEMVKI
jgi:transposase